MSNWTQAMNVRIMERSHINATYVREPSIISHILKKMEEITMERKICKCKECGRTIISSTSLQYMEAPILERNSINVNYMENPLDNVQVFKHLNRLAGKKPYKGKKCSKALSFSALSLFIMISIFIM